MVATIRNAVPSRQTFGATPVIYSAFDRLDKPDKAPVMKAYSLIQGACHRRNPRMVITQSKTWFQMRLETLPYIRIAALGQIRVHGNVTSMRINVARGDLCIKYDKNRYEGSGSKRAAAADIGTAPPAKKRKRARPPYKTFIDRQRFPSIQRVDIDHINQVLNSLCSQYPLMMAFEVNPEIHHDHIVVECRFRDDIEYDSLARIKEEFNSIVYNIDINYPRNTIDFHMYTEQP